MTLQRALSCPFCHGDSFVRAFTFHAPPEGEIKFPFSEGTYHRELFCCQGCGHYLSVHDMDTGDLYAGEYVDASYGPSGLKEAFDKIIAMAPEKSDNRQRVARICDYVLPRLKTRDHKPTLLDVGSGLGVFPHVMKEAGWDCTALDPDERSAQHARDVIGVNGLCGDFMTVDGLGKFDLITFNKVLEHVDDPVAMLGRARDLLNPGGFVYVELPDGEAAISESPGREEFCIDHPHIFSTASMALLVWQGGFAVQALERIREPSTKYTLYSFLTPSC